MSILHIQQLVEDVNKDIYILRESGQLEKRVLAVGIEMNQRFIEYLDELEISPLHIQNGVDVDVDGKIIRFKNMDDFSEWVLEEMQA